MRMQADAANKEMLELLADFLPGRFPDLFSRDGRRLTNLVTQMTWDLDDPTLDHLDVCGRLVQVDALGFPRNSCIFAFAVAADPIGAAETYSFCLP